MDQLFKSGLLLGHFYQKCPSSHDYILKSGLLSGTLITDIIKAHFLTPYVST